MKIVLAFFLLVIYLTHTGVSGNSERFFLDFANGSLVTEDNTEVSGKGAINPLILNGRIPSGGEFPYIAKLHGKFDYTSPKNIVNDITCTTVIINKEFVLTAASCFQNVIHHHKKKDDEVLDIPLLSGVYGVIYVLLNVEDGLGAEESGVRSGVRLIVHGTYYHPSTKNDVNIALVQVLPPWSVSERTSLKLPSPARQPHPRDMRLYSCFGVATGKVNNWDDKGKTWIELNVSGVDYCKFLEEQFDQKSLNVDSFYMCGKSKQQGQGFCDGDTGSALICDGLLAGILSMRVEDLPCQVTGNQYAMFTSVGAPVVYDFIKTYVPDFPRLTTLPHTPNRWKESRR